MRKSKGNRKLGCNCCIFGVDVDGVCDRTVPFDSGSFKLALTMTGQSVFKHFLTEGDRIVVSRVSPLEDQGGYAVASNYGQWQSYILAGLD